VVAKKPLPVVAKKPLPVVAKKPLPVVAKKPLPVVAKKPLPVVVKKPLPVVAKKPLPVVVKKPLPVVAKKPLPVVAKKPLPVVAKKPLPVVVKKPLPVVAKKPLPVVAKKPLPVIAKRPLPGTIVAIVPKALPTLPLIPLSQPAPSNPWAWTNVPVTGDNTSYAQVRKQIDTAVAQGRDPYNLLIKYRNAAHSASSNPVALYRWAYAAYLSATRQTSPAQVYNCIRGLSDARFAVAAVPSYDFNRVRFLIAAVTEPNAELTDLGRRLLDVDPEDDPVEYALCEILLDDYNPPNTIEALGLAQGLINEDPSRAEPYALVGEIYYMRWKAHHEESDGEQARHAYLQYVQMAPDGDAFKNSAAELAAAIGNKLKTASAIQ